jgi:hypothetical protein
MEDSVNFRYHEVFSSPKQLLKLKLNVSKRTDMFHLLGTVHPFGGQHAVCNFYVQEMRNDDSCDLTV